MSELSIQQVSERTGLSPHTLRYYERAGLVPGVERDRSRRRRYSEANVEWIRLLDMLRATGMPVREIRAFLAIFDEGAVGIPRRIEFFEAYRARLLREIELRNRALDLIDQKIRKNRELLAAERAR